MYFRKQVMEKVRKRQQLDEIAEILDKKSNFNEKSYKLYDMEGEPSYSIFGNKKKKKNEPEAVPNPTPYVVSNNTTSQIGNSNVDPKIGNSIRNNSKKFRKNNNKNKKKKGIIIGVTSVLLAGVMVATGFFVTKLLNKMKKQTKDGTSTSQSVDTLGTGSLDLLGEELPKTDTNSEYTKVSGDFNVEDVVRGSDGRLYVDGESARNAEKSGTSEIDTKGGTLEVGSDGDVYTKEEGYEVVDENGNVVDSGTGTPAQVDEGIDYVECPSNYYDDEGNLVHSAGEFITQAELDRCRQYYHTTKPQGDEYVTVEEEIIYYDEEVATTGSEETTKEETKEEVVETKEEVTETVEEITEPAVVEEDTTYEEETTTSYSDSGVVNPDGTYTIYGVTYASYADYQQYIIDGGAGYGYIDGVIQPIGDYEIENQYTL